VPPCQRYSAVSGHSVVAGPYRRDHGRLRRIHLGRAPAAERLQHVLGRRNREHRRRVADYPPGVARTALGLAGYRGRGPLYTLADIVFTCHDQNLKPIPSPASSDAFFLSCNVAFIVGFAILTQSSFGGVHASVRLDGAIAGVAIAALAGVVWGRVLEGEVTSILPIQDVRRP